MYHIKELPFYLTALFVDNTVLNSGSGGDTIASDDIGGVKFQRVKLVEGADGTNDGDISSANPLPVQLSDGVDAALVNAAGDLQVTLSGEVVSIDDNAASLTVDNAALSVTGGGVEAGAQRVTIANDSTGVVSVDDNAGSLTIDNATLSTTGGGVESGALRVTIANDSTGVVSVDDNAGSLTVDGTVTADAGTGTFTVDTADGTIDVVGNVANDAIDSGNPVKIGGQAETALPTAVAANDRVNATFTTTGGQLAAGTDGTTPRNMAVNASGQVEVDIAAQQAGALDVSGATVTTTPAVTGGGTEAAAQRVTIANNSTGVLSVDDNGGSLTVDNAALSTTGGGVESGALRVTIANDSTGLVSVDDNGGSLTIDGSVGLNAGSNNVGDVDIASVVPVTATGTMTAVDQSVSIDVGGYGSVAIQLSGTWTATVGFDATVDGTNWQDLEVVPSSSGTSTTTATGNGIWYVDVGGLNQIRVFTDAFTSGTVQADFQSNIASGKPGREAGGTGGTSMTDDAAFTVGTTAITPVGGTFRSVRDSVDDNDGGAFAMTQQRGVLATLEDSGGTEVGTGGGTEAAALRVTIANDSTGLVSIDDNGGSVTVDGTVSVDNVTTAVTPGTAAANLGKAVDAVAGATDTGVAALAVRDDTLATLTPADADYTRLRTNNRGALWVDQDGVVSVDDNAGSLTVDNAALSVTGGGAEASALRVTIANDSTGVLSIDDNGGSITIDGTVTADAGTGDRNVVGNVAHDAADSGNPVKLGLKSIAHGANPTAVAANNRTDWYANRAGVPFVIGGHPNVVTTEYVATTAQTNDAIVTVAGGLKIVVTEIEALVDNATTVDVGVRIGFGATTVPAEPADGASATGVVLSHPGIAAGSGVVRGSGAGILGIGADGEDLRITNEVPTSGRLRVLVSHYTIES